MATWGSRGLRGSALEDMVNMTIDKYRSKHLALIQKIPTPIKPIHIEKETRHITLAYFEQKSTVDYIGVVQGIPVCFDAKECAVDTFPLQNVHAHQMDFMEEFERQEGVAFFLIYFSGCGEVYYVPYRTMKVFWEEAQNGGKQSFRRSELLEQIQFLVEVQQGFFLGILEALQQDLDLK